MRIAPLSPGTPNHSGKAVGITPKASPDSFTGVLKSKMQEVNKLQNQSDEAMAEGAVQGATNIHETMIKLEEAEISLRLLTKVRNKALDAYQEVMRMQF